MKIPSLVLFILSGLAVAVLIVLLVIAHVKLMLLSHQLIESIGAVSPTEYGRMTRPFAGMVSIFAMSQFLESSNLEEHEQIRNLKDKFRRQVRLLSILFLSLVAVGVSTMLLLFALVMLLPSLGLTIT